MFKGLQLAPKHFYFCTELFDDFREHLLSSSFDDILDLDLDLYIFSFYFFLQLFH